MSSYVTGMKFASWNHWESQQKYESFIIFCPLLWRVESPRDPHEMSSRRRLRAVELVSERLSYTRPCFKAEEVKTRGRIPPLVTELLSMQYCDPYPGSQAVFCRRTLIGPKVAWRRIVSKSGQQFLPVSDCR